MAGRVDGNKAVNVGRPGKIFFSKVSLTDFFVCKLTITQLRICSLRWLLRSCLAGRPSFPCRSPPPAFVYGRRCRCSNTWFTIASHSMSVRSHRGRYWFFSRSAIRLRCRSINQSNDYSIEQIVLCSIHRSAKRSRLCTLTKLSVYNLSTRKTKLNYRLIPRIDWLDGLTVDFEKIIDSVC